MSNKKVTLYGVLRLDRHFEVTDIFGHPVKRELEKGMYAMPVFDSRDAAEECADNRFEIIEFDATPNTKQQ